MSTWPATVIVLLGSGTVSWLLRRAVRVSHARHLARGGTSGRVDTGPPRRRASMSQWRLVVAARTRRERRHRDAALPAYAEAVARELRAGCALTEAVALATASVGDHRGPNLDVVVGLGTEIGGQLAGAFDSLADAARDDLELRDEVRALTAQSRASAILLTILPFGAAALVGVLQPSTVAFLVGTTGGWACLGAAVSLLVVGWAWMASMVRSV